MNICSCKRRLCYLECGVLSKMINSEVGSILWVAAFDGRLLCPLTINPYVAQYRRQNHHCDTLMIIWLINWYCYSNIFIYNWNLSRPVYLNSTKIEGGETVIYKARIISENIPAYKSYLRRRNIKLILWWIGFKGRH